MEEAVRCGFTADDFDDDTEVSVWACNAESFLVFLNLQTQWRVVPGRLVGLDYTAIEPVLRLMAVEPGRWPVLFDDLRAMEGAALKAVHVEKNSG